MVSAELLLIKFYLLLWLPWAQRAAKLGNILPAPSHVSWASLSSTHLRHGISPLLLQGYLLLVFFNNFFRYFLHLHVKCYPESPLYPPLSLLPNPPTPASRPWHSPVLGHMIFARPRASPPIDGCPLLHMQLEIQLWGLLVSSYC